MNITKASRITGLTKGQLRFYEDEGLINPEKNKNNGQRIYEDKDLKIAKLIDGLSILGFSIKIIKELIGNRIRLIEAIKERLSSLNISAEDSKIINNIISDIEDVWNKDKEIVIEYVMKIVDIIEKKKEEMDEEYINYKLIRFFPGNYGKLVIFQLGHFLNIKLDSENKKEAFKKVVRYLDTLSNYKIPKDMDNLLDTLDKDILLELKKEKRNTILSVINNDSIEIERIKAGILEFLNNVSSDKKYRAMYLKSKKRNKTLEDMLKENGTYEEFKESFRVLSKEYVAYLSSVENIERSLNMSYDKEGVPYIIG